MKIAGSTINGIEMMGGSIQCEVQSSHGFTDAVVKTDQCIFVLEFKNVAQGGAQAGLAQIHKKKYYDPYLADKRDVIIAGISFDPGEKNLVEVLSEPVYNRFRLEEKEISQTLGISEKECGRKIPLALKKNQGDLEE